MLASRPKIIPKLFPQAWNLSKLHLVPSNRRLCSKNILSHPETFIHAIASRRSTRGMPCDSQQSTGINTQPSYSHFSIASNMTNPIYASKEILRLFVHQNKGNISLRISVSTVSLHNHIIVSITHKGMLPHLRKCAILVLHILQPTLLPHACCCFIYWVNRLVISSRLLQSLLL